MLATASGLLAHRPVGSVAPRHGNQDRIVAIRGAHWPASSLTAATQLGNWRARWSWYRAGTAKDSLALPVHAQPV